MGSKANKKRTSEFHGALLVDKPAGVTSHDVVDRVRRIFATRRVGHTGTLDPQATGLLVLLLGEATKISEYLVGCDKSYEGTMRLGVVSDTYDVEGKVVDGPGAAIPTSIPVIQDIADGLTGETDQVPPPYSAKKVAGKKLYEYARKGQDPGEVKARRIHVQDYEIITLEGDTSEFGVDCSSGTYVRSLVHDLGQQLGCGAILTELNRTDVGPFRLEDAQQLDELEAITSKRKLREYLIPITRALGDVPVLYLVNDGERWLRNGQAIPHGMVHSEDNLRPTRGARVLLARVNGDPLAIARVEPAPTSPPPKAMLHTNPPWYQPVKLFEIDPLDEEEEDDEIVRPAPKPRRDGKPRDAATDASDTAPDGDEEE